MPQPLVSIVTPSFNQAEFLQETLESVAQQDYPSIEHIIVDGGSTDGSVEILKRFPSSPRLRWVSEADAGQADAIRKGFSTANGRIFAWLNSDDIYLRRDAVSRAVAAMNTGASVVTARGRFLDRDGRDLGPVDVRPDYLAPQVLARVDAVLQPATFFQKSVWEAVRIDPSLHYVFDWDLFIQMSRVTDLTFLDIELAGYRLHAQGKTVSGGADRQRELLVVAERYGRARPILWCMRAQIGIRAIFPLLGPVLDRLASYSNRFTRNHGLPC